MVDTVLVVAGGGPPAADAVTDQPSDAYVIAADSGLDHALAFGLQADLVVGDLDSVSPHALEAARNHGTEIEQHPTAKDATDLELALDRAVALQPRRIVVIGDSGGRLDHLLGAVLLLASDRYTGPQLEARLGEARITVIRDGVELHGQRGKVVTLLPVGGRAEGVVTEGLRYPLRDEDLAPGTSRGISNEFVEPTARVTLGAGVLLAIQPEGVSPSRPWM